MMKPFRKVLWSPLSRTILIAAAAPLGVLLYFVAATSDSIARDELIEKWQTGGHWRQTSGGGSYFHIGPKPVFLFFRDLPDDSRYSLLQLELFVRRPLQEGARLLCRIATDPPGIYRTRILVGRPVREVGWNHIVCSIDDYSQAFEADMIGFYLASPGGANVAAVRNVHLKSFTFSQRLRQVLSRAFTHHPLTVVTINFIEGPQLVGHGLAIVFWIGGLLAVMALLVRRLLLRESFPMLLHAVVTIVVLVVVADLRNSSDYAQNIAVAAKRYIDSQDLSDYLDMLENDIPWFGPMVRYMRISIAPDQRCYLKVGGRLRIVVPRMWYYAHPTGRAETPEEADVLMLLNASVEINDPTRWRQPVILPGGCTVYQRLQ